MYCVGKTTAKPKKGFTKSEPRKAPVIAEKDLETGLAAELTEEPQTANSK